MAKALSKKDVDLAGIFPLLPNETIEFTPERWAQVPNAPVFVLRGSSESEASTKRKMHTQMIKGTEQDIESGHENFIKFIFGHIVEWKNMRSAKGTEIPFTFENFELVVNASPVVADDLYNKIMSISQLSDGL